MLDFFKALWKRFGGTFLKLACLVAILGAVIVSFMIMSDRYFQSEARRGLTMIVTEQVLYHEEHFSWADSFRHITFGTSYMSRYAFFLSPTDYVGVSPEKLGISLPVNFEAYGAPRPGLTEDGFVAVAIGNLDSDEVLDVWWVDQSRALTNSRDDAMSWRYLFERVKDVIGPNVG